MLRLPVFKRKEKVESLLAIVSKLVLELYLKQCLTAVTTRTISKYSTSLSVKFKVKLYSLNYVIVNDIE